MAKKNKNTLYYVLGAIVVVVVLVFLFTGKQEAPAPSAPVVDQPEPTPTVTEPSSPEPTQEVVTNEEGDIDYGTRGILSDVKCDGKTISAIITNTQTETMNAIPKYYDTELKIQVKGVNQQEFVCDAQEIAPGESIYCSDLIGNQKRKDVMIKSDVSSEVEVAVWFKNDKSNRGIETVICSG